MYIDYGDPHIVKVKRLEKKKGNKYQTLIGYDEENREYLLNMKWCERYFNKNNAGIRWLNSFKKQKESLVV